MSEQVSEPNPGTGGRTRRETLSQFLRFVVVGVSAVLIDAGIHYLLMFVLRLHGRPLSEVVGERLARRAASVNVTASGHALAFGFFKVFSTCCGIVNSFYWNRRWTFASAAGGSSKRQFQRYATVVAIGLVLNTAIATGLNAILPFEPKARWAVATLVATVAVSLWNFNGHKRYSFAPGLVDEEPSARGRSVLLRGAVAAFLALGALAALASLRYPIQHDGPVVMYPASLVWSGQRHLYRDLFDFNLPGTYGIYGLIGLLTDFRDLPVQILHLALLAGLGLLTLRVAGRAMRLAAGLAFATYLAVLFGDFHDLALQREFFVVLLVAGASALALDGEKEVGTMVALGALGGYAALVKPHAIFAFLILLGLRLSWRRASGDRAKRIGAFGLGLALPVGVALAMVAAAGGLGEMLWIVKNYVPLYGAMTGDHTVLSSGERSGYLLSHLFAFRFVAVLAVAGIGYALTRPERREEPRLGRVSTLLLALAGFFFVYPVFSGQFWTYHYLPFAYFAGFSVAVSIHTLAKRGVRKPAAQAFGGAVLVSLLAVSFGELKQLVRPTDLQINPNAAMIRDFLVRNLRAGETVQPLDWTAGCVEGMLRARAPLATRFVYDFHFYHHVSTPTVQELRRRVIEELDASRPAFVLQAYGESKPWPAGVDTTRSFPELDRRLSTEYRVAEDNGAVRILVRRDRSL